PVVDGRLDDAVWSRAEPAGDFVQMGPKPGEPATLRTEARIVYDAAAVYVAVRAYDPRPDSIVGQLARRDAEVHSDWVHVGFDSYHDRRTAYVFGVNPRGVKSDVFLYDDGNDDSNWNAVWDGAAQVDSLGWTAEFRIPLSQLRYNVKESGAAGYVWGFNVRREVARTKEESFWAPILPSVRGLVSRFGELRGLSGLTTPGRLEVQPYTMGSVTRAPLQDGNPFYRRNDPVGRVGADLKYAITSNFTLNATLNPDFGQVEADPSQVNLTAYETFLPEQRPFFMEGADIFRFGLGAGDGDFGSESLFYSRRIGRRPQGSVPGAARFADAPEASTILGAAKLTGKTSSGWSVGLLNAVTGREEARFLASPGEERSVAVEPLTNYAVARATRDFRGGQTAFGGILTSTHRDLDAEEQLSFLHSSAYSGGLNLRHRFGPGGRYEVKSWVLGSWVEGDSTALMRTQRSSRRYFQRPDADHVDFDRGRTSLGGWAASTELLKVGGGNLNYGGILNLRSPGFETNDLGYQRDADMILGAGFMSYQQPKAGKAFRRWGVNGSAWNVHSFGGEMLGTGGNVNGNVQFLNFWSAHGGANRQSARTAVGALWGGPSLQTPGSWNFFGGVNTDQRKKVTFSLNGSGSLEDETDGHSWRLSSSVSWKASTRANLSLRPSYSQDRSAWQFIPLSRRDDGQPHYVFGALDQTTVSLTARLNYTFTPNLSLQFYAQPFVSAGEYSDFREVALADGGNRVAAAARFADRFRSLGQVAPTERGEYRIDTNRDGSTDFRFGSPDFNFKQLRSNAVLRWEYRPGSTLFVVWSQVREDFDRDGRFRMGRDFQRLLGADDEFPVQGTNVLLLKVNYWLNL
ncbi:MAG: carbohydrate binding family 9 domain-containing protein, partial [Gemmatimonadota bacterium]|nr:carbohydrate binding family 9 domain-containing protein [Gemmatimonadota bacterium]